MIQHIVPDFLGKGGFILCLEGTADISTHNRTYHMDPGMIFITTPLVNVQTMTLSKDFAYLMFLDDLKVFYPIFIIISETGIPMAVREQPCWSISKELFDFILTQAERVDGMMSDIEVTSCEYGFMASHCEIIRRDTMMEVLRERFKGSFALTGEQNKYNKVAYQFILDLHKNYKTRRSVDWYAVQAGLSPGYFADVIRKVTGISPSKWISSITVSYARLLLEKTKLNIKEIAEELNFPEQFTFRKYFKKHSGLSPKEYRLQLVYSFDKS